MEDPVKELGGYCSETAENTWGNGSPHGCDEGEHKVFMTCISWKTCTINSAVF